LAKNGNKLLYTINPRLDSSNSCSNILLHCQRRDSNKRQTRRLKLGEKYNEEEAIKETAVSEIKR